MVTRKKLSMKRKSRKRKDREVTILVCSDPIVGDTILFEVKWLAGTKDSDGNEREADHFSYRCFNKSHIDATATPVCYMKEHPDNTLESFCKKYNMNPEAFMPFDVEDPENKDMCTSVEEWATFIGITFELVSESRRHWVEAKVEHVATEKEFVYTGNKAQTEGIAKRRFFNAFNMTYPGCCIDLSQLDD